MKHFTPILAVLLFAAGCASTPTLEERRIERAAAYAALSPAEKALVDKGQIGLGMNEDAVFIAWGAPDEIVHSEDANGRLTRWLYRGTYFKEQRYWTFREVPTASGGRNVFERYLETTLDSRSYVSSEITFKDGAVLRWRTLPKPADY